MNLTVSIPQEAMYSWDSQAVQYAEVGKEFGTPFSIVLFVPVGPDIIHCLLHYDETGKLDGILNHYPNDIPPWEDAGNFNVWVRPDSFRAGIGKALVAEADRLWNLDFTQQRYTVSGAKLVASYLFEMNGHEFVDDDGDTDESCVTCGAPAEDHS